MASRSISSFSTVAMASLAILFMASFATAQDADCAQKLVPCSDYLNSTSTPPDSCCNPIKEAVATQLPCLCNLYTSPGLLASLGVNLTDALRLTQSCGVSIDISKCNTSSPSPQTSPPPPAAGNDGNDGDRIRQSGFLCLILGLGSALLFGSF